MASSQIDIPRYGYLIFVVSFQLEQAFCPMDSFMGQIYELKKTSNSRNKEGLEQNSLRVSFPLNENSTQTRKESNLQRPWTSWKVQKSKEGAQRGIFVLLQRSLWREFIVVREEFKRLYWLWRFGSGGRFSKALLFWSSRFVDRQLIEHNFIYL